MQEEPDEGVLPRQPPVWAERPRRGRTRLAAAVAASLATHVAILLAVIAAAPKPPALPPPPPILVDLAAPLSLAAPSPSPSAAPVSPRPPPPRTLVARRTPAPPRDDTTPADDSTPTDPGPGLTDAQLAGAATAGSGGAGGACDMARRLQDALRRDPLAQAAVARFGGRAIMVWNGDWIWMPGEDGKGLAAVRQAMMWEIAFSPKACQGQQVHGLVVIAAAEGHSGARLAVGLNSWRWSDLLIPHPSVGEGVYEP